MESSPGVLHHEPSCDLHERLPRRGVLVFVFDASPLPIVQSVGMAEPVRTLPLPNDPTLAAYATALNEAGHWAVVLDATWRLVFATDEARVSWGDVGVETFVPVGCHYFSEEVWQFFAARGGGSLAQEAFRRATFSKLGGFALAGTPGGTRELRGLVGRDFADLVDGLQPQDLPIISLATPYNISFAGTDVGAFSVLLRINDDQGRVAGVCMLLKPEVGMSQLAAAAATADLGHLERMRSVERPDRRPTAILMADLEASSPLALSAFHCAVLRVRSSSRPRGRSVRRRRGRNRRSARRRWRRGVLPRRSRRFGIRRRAIMHRCRERATRYAH